MMKTFVLACWGNFEMGDFKWSIWAVAIHTALVLLVAIVVAHQLPQYPESVMLWSPFVLIDFPSSFLFGLVDGEWMTEKFSFEMRYVYGYGLGFATFGGVQYFIVSYLLYLFAGKMREWPPPKLNHKKEATNDGQP